MQHHANTVARVVAVTLGFALLLGCATVGISDGTERPVPQAALLEGYRADGAATIRVTRVSRVGGAGCEVRLSANGIPVADIGSGRYVSFGVNAGTVTLRAHYAQRGLCPAQMSTLTVTADKAIPVTVVYDISHQGQHVFQVM